jgi:hypothetical protein
MNVTGTRKFFRLGSWYVHFNREGKQKPPNKEGHYDFRGQKVHFTRVRLA